MKKLETMTKSELLAEAAGMGIEVSYPLSKKELVELISSFDNVVRNDESCLIVESDREGSNDKFVDASNLSSTVIESKAIAKVESSLAGKYLLLCGAMLAGKNVQIGTIMELGVEDAAVLLAQGAVEVAK
jgi:hypothetical protein